MALVDSLDAIALARNLVQWAMPPASLAVGIIVGLLAMIVGWRRLGYLIVGSVIAETLLFSFPPAVSILLRVLEDRALIGAETSARCCYDAIVVLGGSVAPASPPTRNTPRLTAASDRLWQAARLYHDGVSRRIIVSGGSFATLEGNKSAPEAEAMRIFLLDLGVPSDAIVLEGQSRDTIENIQNVRTIVKDGRVLLVTSAYHMLRAMRIATAAELHATPYPVDFHGLNLPVTSWRNWTFSAAAMEDANLALHEILALTFDHREGASPR